MTPEEILSLISHAAQSEITLSFETTRKAGSVRKALYKTLYSLRMTNIKISRQGATLTLTPILTPTFHLKEPKQ